MKKKFIFTFFLCLLSPLFFSSPLTLNVCTLWGAAGMDAGGGVQPDCIEPS